MTIDINYMSLNNSMLLGGNMNCECVQKCRKGEADGHRN